MTDATDGTDYAALFGLAARHTLHPSRRTCAHRGAVSHETRWLDEHDAEGRPVARYRTWIVRSSEPPYRVQLGWERWSLDGALLDREVRYSTRASVAALN